ncbi:hypothetical protein, partial [Pseudomonas laurylsulfatiphila]|uniref:hypothetical protein n=1 Tax=Pseudomonas laurylsulfatiphila TaxID=2011015 RepID=UPI003D10054A
AENQDQKIAAFGSSYAMCDVHVCESIQRSEIKTTLPCQQSQRLRPRRYLSVLISVQRQSSPL